MYEEKENNTTKPLKKRKLCRGGRSHDYVLELPSYVEHNADRSPEKDAQATKEYYKLYLAYDEQVAKLNEAFIANVKALGIKERRYGYLGDSAVTLTCANCGKTEWVRSTDKKWEATLRALMV